MRTSHLEAKLQLAAAAARDADVARANASELCIELQQKLESGVVREAVLSDRIKELTRELRGAKVLALSGIFWLGVVKS
jgi:hypothetical protein